MLGAIIGGVIGSVYEGVPVKIYDFDFFPPGTTYTDDTVLTIAVAAAILKQKDYQKMLLKYGHKYSEAGYGKLFDQWLKSSNPVPYNSWGNGAAMRVSPIGFAFDNKIEVLEQARKSAAITHNHPEGIKAAEAVALAIYLARTGHDKQQIQHELQNLFGYDLRPGFNDIHDDYKYTYAAKDTIPQCLIAFLDSESYEDAIRLVISLGGNADAMANITGAIAQAYYKFIPVELITQTTEYLPNKFLKIMDEFERLYVNR